MIELLPLYLIIGFFAAFNYFITSYIEANGPEIIGLIGRFLGWPIYILLRFIP